MVVRVKTVIGQSIESRESVVEVDLQRGQFNFDIVGLVGKSINESKERVKSAIINSGFPLPGKHIVVNITPAEEEKEGSHYDLAIAVGILAEMQIIPSEVLKNLIVVGELGLDGAINWVRGAINGAILAKKHSKILVCPQKNLSEVDAIPNVDVLPFLTLNECINQISVSQAKKTSGLVESDSDRAFVDLSEIVGHEFAKRGLLISACGGHNLLMTGPPGSGKSLLSKAFIGLLPSLTFEQAVEVGQIYSSVGLLSGKLTNSPPLRTPHHTISHIAMVGGGRIPRAGEITLAHNGVLFLDEFPEFQRISIESLREPLEEKKLTISRANGSVCFPANFILLAAMNPCPCGYYGDLERKCVCSEGQISKYLRKISGPILDRIDISMAISRVNPKKIISSETSKSTREYKADVVRCRELQQKRYSGLKISLNSQASIKELDKFGNFSVEAKNIIETASHRLKLSTRSIIRSMRVARTIADIEGSNTVFEAHMLETLQYRLKNEVNV